MASVSTVRPNFVIPDPGPEQLLYWRLKSTASCFVYVICIDGLTPIKVGKAKDVTTRMAELQTGCPYRLELLHVLVGGLDLERELHQMLGYQERLVGEWFDGPAIDGFLRLIEGIAADMVLAHKNSGHVPDYRNFSPFRERHGPSTYVDWTDQRRAEREPRTAT
jgi:hypothetical protein